MTTKLICDVCKLETQYSDRFEFRGHTCNDFHMDYWHADICFHCQFKMRQIVGIHDEKFDIRRITLRGKGN